jgi:type I restriction enzyme R subunit
VHDKLVLDWRRKSATTAEVRTTILDVLDAELPADPYPPEVFEDKVQAVFDHIATAYGDDGSSVYRIAAERLAAAGVARVELPATAAELTEDVVERLRHDAEFVALVAAKLGLVGRPELRTVQQLIENDEDYAVEFKSTARWNVREGQPDKAMEDAVVKTVAGFLNAEGGTLLIGIGPDRDVVGLDHDYARVKPTNGDGFVNWLTTHLINTLGYTPVTFTRARIDTFEGQKICRVDVAASPAPVRARTSKAADVLFVRMNNSTRSLPDNEIDATHARTGLSSARGRIPLRRTDAWRASSRTRAWDGCRMLQMPVPVSTWPRAGSAGGSPWACAGTTPVSGARPKPGAGSGTSWIAISNMVVVMT